MFIYRAKDTGVFEVGHYAPSSGWSFGATFTQFTFVTESEHISARDAATRVNYLNGGTGAPTGTVPTTSNGGHGVRTADL